MTREGLIIGSVIESSHEDILTRYLMERRV